MTVFATLKTNPETAEITGTITGLTFTKALRFLPVSSTSRGAPAYRVMTGETEVGAAWEEVARGSGYAYHSVKLDSPELLCPIYLAMFPSRNQPGAYELTWTRNKGGRAQTGPTEEDDADQA